MRTLLSILAILISMILPRAAQAAADRPYDHVSVDARANSSTGGVGKDTNFDVLAGETLQITADPRQRWSAGPDTPYNRKSNADGLGRLSQHTQAELTANFGALVGRIGSGAYFLVGTSYRAKATETGRLHLYYWDSNNADNTGSISVKIRATGGSCRQLKAHHDRLAKAHGVMGGGRGQTVATKLAAVRSRIARLESAQDMIEAALRKTEAGAAELERLEKQNKQRSTVDAPSKSGTKAVSYGALQALKTAAAKKLLGWIGVVADIAESTGRTLDKAETARHLAEFLARSQLHVRELNKLHTALSADIRTEEREARKLRTLKALLDELYARWSECVAAKRRR